MAFLYLQILCIQKCFLLLLVGLFPMLLLLHDVLLFLLTAPETLRQMKELLEAGPKMRLQGGSSAYEGFANCQAYFVRNLLGYLALTKDKRLTEWIEAEKGDWKEEAESEHRKIKTLKLVEALQKLE